MMTRCILREHHVANARSFVCLFQLTRGLKSGVMCFLRLSYLSTADQYSGETGVRAQSCIAMSWQQIIRAVLRLEVDFDVLTPGV